MPIAAAMNVVFDVAPPLRVNQVSMPRRILSSSGIRARPLAALMNARRLNRKKRPRSLWFWAGQRTAWRAARAIASFTEPLSPSPWTVRLW